MQRIGEKVEKILSVFSREVHTYIFAPSFYAVSLPYLLIPTYLYFRQAFLSSYADMRFLFDTIPWALLIFVPALSMRHLTEERKQGTYELLMSSPISEEILIGGKYISVLVLATVVNAFFLLLPAIISPFAAFDIGKVIGGFLATVLLTSFLVSLSLFVASFTTSQYATFLLTTVVTIILYLSSMNIVSLAFPASLRTVLELISPLVHFSNFSKGLIDFSSLYYFIATTWFFLYSASLNLKLPYITQKDQKKRYLIVWLMAVSALILALVLSSLINSKIDMTREQVFTLTESTKKVLSSLDSKVVIKVFSSKELPPEISTVYRDMQDLLSEYRKQSRGKIEIVNLQPDANPKHKIEASNYGIPPIQFNVISNEEYRVKEGYLGLVILSGSKFDTIPIVTSIGDFELKLTSAIYGVTNKKKKKIGILSDAGAKNQLSGLSVTANLLSKQYEVEEVFASRKEYDLSKYDVLLLIGPTTTLETTAINRIRQYLGAGGSLLIAADTVNVNPQTMSGENSKININEIIGPYGLTMDFNIVMDLKNYENVVVSGENSYVIPYPFWIRPIIPSNAVARSLGASYRRMALLWPSSIEIHKMKDISYYPILKTSDYGAKQENFYMLEPNQNFEAYAQRKETFNLGVACESKQKDRRSRLVAIGDSDFIDDSFIQQNQENLGFILSAIHWLARNDILLGLKQKNVRPEAFNFPSKTIREGIRYATLAIMALMVVGFGLGYRYVHIKSLREKYAEQEN
ncbi:MAG: Gldg family protein [Actinobacteria bacterium]|nr:Gldg family protein [Actinomycetota bacterium]